jgi:predicted HAD superfamily Cof-like phosphohydrolase
MNLFDAHQDMVQWMKAFGQETPSEPCIPAQNIIDLRANLIEEECKEIIDALDVVNNAKFVDSFDEVLDGLADSLFVIIGTFVALGVPTEEVYKEISRSNWTKLWTLVEIDSCCDKELIVTQVIPTSSNVEKSFLVKNSHGKIIKSPSFSPPDLSKWRVKS